MWRLLAVCTVLVGCTSIVPSTALKLNSVDPLTADPSDVSVALALPDGLGVLQDTVRLSLSAKTRTEQTIGETWTLVETRDAENRLIYRLADTDWAAVRRVQETARTWKAADPDGTVGSLTLSLSGCRTVPLADLTDARASVFVSLAKDAGLVPLFRDAPLRRVLSNADLQNLPNCS